MGKIGTFIHVDKDIATGNKAVGTAYIAANFMTIVLDQPNVFGDSFKGHLGAVHCVVNTLNGLSATPKLTFRVSADELGNVPIIPDTEADITQGITAATDGMVIGAVDLDFAWGGDGISQILTRTVYIHSKIDQGTCNLHSAYITWRE